ncbi:MAG TPA: translation initiation factor IF-3, partial [candidate division WOR-3 bacterium]|nr:translation initiation factor IF-3 [candidate division WOR-3 bacterium]
KYEERKKQKEAKKKQAGEVREISMGPRISEHDLGVKLKKVREFLGDGAKVKIRIFFKGRELAHPEYGEELIKKILEELKEEAQVEIPPKMDGRNLTCLLKPVKKN